jgi:hypothetical protein
LNKTVFLEFTPSFFFKIYMWFCVKFTNFQTLKLYITSNFFLNEPQYLVTLKPINQSVL